MRKIKLAARLLVTAFKQFAKHEVYSESAKQKPPIRYDGDPTEIYLA